MDQNVDNGHHIFLEQAGLPGQTTDYWKNIVQKTPLLNQEATLEETEKTHTFTAKYNISIIETDTEGNSVPKLGVVNIGIYPVSTKEEESGNSNLYTVESDTPVSEKKLDPLPASTFVLRDYAYDTPEDFIEPDSTVEVEFDKNGQMIKFSVTKSSKPTLDPDRAGSVPLTLTIRYPVDSLFDAVDVVASGMPLMPNPSKGGYAPYTQGDRLYFDFTRDIKGLEIPASVGVRDLKPPVYRADSA